MRLIKQRLPRDCAVCAVAMVADSDYKEVLMMNPNFDRTPTAHWLNYMLSQGFELNQVGSLFSPAPGVRYFCVCGIEGNDDLRASHTIVVDEDGKVFDPSTMAPAPGTLEISWYRTPPNRLIYCFEVIPKDAADNLPKV